MGLHATLHTHESIVHAQIHAIEKLLARDIIYQITLNVQGTRSHIRFPLSNTEAKLIQSNLGYKITFVDSQSGQETEVEP